MTPISDVVLRFGARLDEVGPRPPSMTRDEWFERRCVEMRAFATPAEEALGALLAARKSWHFASQQRIGDYIVDFCDEDVRVVIEVDGSSHDGHSELDERRDANLRKRGYEVVRCTNSEVFQQPDAVLVRVVYARVAARKAANNAR